MIGQGASNMLASHGIAVDANATRLEARRSIHMYYNNIVALWREKPAATRVSEYYSGQELEYVYGAGLDLPTGSAYARATRHYKSQQETSRGMSPLGQDLRAIYLMMVFAGSVTEYLMSAPNMCPGILDDIYQPQDEALTTYIDGAMQVVSYDSDEEDAPDTTENDDPMMVAGGIAMRQVAFLLYATTYRDDEDAAYGMLQRMEISASMIRVIHEQMGADNHADVMYPHHYLLLIKTIILMPTNVMDTYRKLVRNWPAASASETGMHMYMVRALNYIYKQHGDAVLGVLLDGEPDVKDPDYSRVNQRFIYIRSLYESRQDYPDQDEDTATAKYIQKLVMMNTEYGVSDDALLEYLRDGSWPTDYMDGRLAKYMVSYKPHPLRPSVGSLRTRLIAQLTAGEITKQDVDTQYLGFLDVLRGLNSETAVAGDPPPPRDIPTVMATPETVPVVSAPPVAVVHNPMLPPPRVSHMDQVTPRHLVQPAPVAVEPVYATAADIERERQVMIDHYGSLEEYERVNAIKEHNLLVEHALRIGAAVPPFVPPTPVSEKTWTIIPEDVGRVRIGDMATVNHARDLTPKRGMLAYMEHMAPITETAYNYVNGIRRFPGSAEWSPYVDPVSVPTMVQQQTATLAPTLDDLATASVRADPAPVRTPAPVQADSPGAALSAQLRELAEGIDRVHMDAKNYRMARASIMELYLSTFNIHAEYPLSAEYSDELIRTHPQHMQLLRPMELLDAIHTSYRSTALFRSLAPELRDRTVIKMLNEYVRASRMLNRGIPL